MSILRKNRTLLVGTLILIGAFLRFYNLNWGSPFYFHPDERNVVDLVLKTSLSNPETLLKGTFAYGNFPVILTLLLKPLLVPFLKSINILDPFAQTVIVLRTISAFFSVFLLYMIYACGKFWSEKIAIIALFFSVFSVGLVQQAHFGTFDGFVAFCAVTVFYFLLKFIKTGKIIFMYSSTLFIAIGCAAKINLGILLLFPLGLIIKDNYKDSKKYLYIFKHLLDAALLFLIATPIFSPAYLTPEFFNSLFYERSLVTGAIPVFYTQSFSNTVPVIFQFLHVFPFLINPLLTVIFIPSFFYLFYKAKKTKNTPSLLLIAYCLLLFLPQAFLFAKWTRYMIPTLPFIYLIAAISVSDFWKRPQKVLSIKYLVFSILIGSSLIFGFSYFMTAFARPDNRIDATEFAKYNVPKTATILSEPYDLGLMPFNSISPNITIFNFYDLDNNSPESSNLALSTDIQSADYIILPSQRLLRSRILNQEKFPKGHTFYSDLINGDLGYKKIYETPCDIFCKITYLNDPVFGFEETATVFDRPVVFVFKKR